MAVVVTAIFMLVGVVLLWPLAPGFGGVGALLYWTFLTLVASAVPVRMPRGSMVSVSIAPILVTAALGGPAAAAIVAAVGTTEVRELRGRIPWYGSLYNHAVLVIPAIAAAVAYQATAGSSFAPEIWSLAAMALAGAVYFSINAALSALPIGIRTGQSPVTVLAGDVRLVAGNLLGMAPLAWLIAMVWQVTWWATLIFALPLYTTRSAYQWAVGIREMFTQTVRALASAVDARDPFTATHSERVQAIAVDIGRVMRCSQDELEALEWGGLLHDIGKIGVRDDVLLKQDRLTREERIKMNAHPVKGEEIIKPVTRLAPELPIIRHHHEWYNGSGYPDHLAGEEIPKLARILHLADAFEAMTAARPYRMRPLTPEQALGELRRYAGIQFDPDVLDAFVRTDWVAGVADAGRPPAQPIPLLAQAAAMRARSTQSAPTSRSATGN